MRDIVFLVPRSTIGPQREGAEKRKRDRAKEPGRVKVRGQRAWVAK